MDNLYIKKVLHGDYIKFSYFIDKYKDMAYSIAFRIVNDDEKAKTIVFNAFLEAYKSLNTLRPDSKFSTWLYRIVINASLSSVENNKITSEIINLEDILNIEIDQIKSGYSHLNKSDKHKFINQTLSELQMEERLLLTIFYLNKNTLEEITEITGIKKDNLKMRIRNARQKMFIVLNKKLQSQYQNLA